MAQLSHRELLLRALGSVRPRQFFSYEQLSEMTGLTTEQVKKAVYRADRSLLVQQNRTLMNRRGEGVYVGEAREHLIKAVHHRERMRRRTRRNMTLLTHVVIRELSFHELEAFERERVRTANMQKHAAQRDHWEKAKEELRVGAFRRLID